MSLPPKIWAELFFDGAWNDVTRDVRQTTPVSITRGLSSESSSEASPTTCECVLDNRDEKYSPRNPISPLYGKIGRNTPFRIGYRAGSPWAEFNGGLNYGALFSNYVPEFNVDDLDLRIDLALEDWSESQMLALRYVPTANDSWALEIIDGVLTFLWSTDGTLAGRSVQQSTEPVLGYNGQRMALRVTLDVDNGAGGYELRFYTGRTVEDEEWDLLGDPIVGGSTTSIYKSTAYLEFGAGFSFNALPSGGSLNRMRGKAYALKLLDGINGTVKVDMATRGAEPGGTTFVDATGHTWSRGGDAVFTNRHVRMTGEVPAWPPTQDLSGNDSYVSIEPTGVMRRMDAGNKPVDSALLRYIKANSPIDCWPLTDGPASPAAKSLVGGADMRQEIVVGLDTAAEWQKGELADWVEPVILVKADTTGALRASCRHTASVDEKWSVDLFLSGGGTPSAGQFTVTDVGAGTDSDEQVSIQMIWVGNLDQVTLIRQSRGETESSSALLANVANVGIYDENPHHVRLTVDPTGSSTQWYFYVDGTLRANGLISGIAVKGLKEILLGWGFLVLPDVNMTDRSYGFLTYWDGSGPEASDIYSAYMGFQGEKAGDRIERIAGEAGYAATVAGERTYQRAMGIQDRKKLLELLNEANRTNFGYLMEARDRGELIHRGQSTLWNQPPALTLDFSSGVISSPFKPVDDDKMTENDVSVKRAYGSSPGRQVLEEGPLSVQDFPNGVGRYDTEYTYSLHTDDQANQVAHMRLHLGTYDGVRYTRIALDLANPRVSRMLDEILRVDCGDKIRLTNIPSSHGMGPVDVLVQGYTEEAGPEGWKVTFNCVPGSPWTAGVVDSESYGRADTSGCELTAGVTAAQTAISVTTTAQARWVDSATYPEDFPFDISVGGEVMRVTACTGTSSSQTFTVVRGVNGIVKAHESGQGVSLAYPVYAAM